MAFYFIFILVLICTLCKCEFESVTKTFRDEVQMSHFKIGTPEKGTIIVLHGYPDTPYSWMEVGEKLSKEGYQILIPFLRGYENSSITNSSGQVLFPAIAQDMRDLASFYEGTGPFHFVGHDWGAGVGYYISQLHHSFFTSVTALAVPPLNHKSNLMLLLHHPMQIVNCWYMFLNMLPFSSYLTPMFHIRYLWESWSPNHIPSKAAWEGVEGVFTSRELRFSSQNYYKDNLPVSLFPTLPKTWSTTYQLSWALGKLPLPTSPLCEEEFVMFVYGEKDGCFEKKLADRLGKSTSNLRYETLPNVGHFMQDEDPTLVTNTILDHITKRISCLEEDKHHVVQRFSIPPLIEMKRNKDEM